jgi:tetratricopeptide (TPR) repeat protein
MMEHRTYLAMGGAALGAGWILARFGDRAAAALLALLVLGTLGRGAVWAEPRALWAEACRVSPRAQKAWINLGQTDDFNTRRWTLRALRIRPGDTEAVMNLGALDADTGNAAEAERLWRLLPDHPQALFGLGNLCQESGRLDEAEAAYRRSIALSRRRNLRALNALGTLLAERKNAEGARALFEEALSRKPDYFEARLNLGLVLLSQGQFEAGAQALETARALDPEDPGVNLALGSLYKCWGNAFWASRPVAEDPEASLAACATLAEAARRLAPVLQRNPDDPSVLKARDLLRQTDGYWRKALEATRCVVAFPEPRQRLHVPRKRSFAALALEQMGEIATLRGDLEEGLDLLRRALALDPGNARIRAFLDAHPAPPPPPPLGKPFLPEDLPAP